jgi:hypothetical protein
MSLQVAIAEVEEILSSKTKFRSNQHFLGPRDSKGPACHCHYYAFGKIDPAEFIPDSSEAVKYPCGHYHRGACQTCGSVERFDIQLHGLIDQIRTLPGEEVEKAKQLDFQYHLDRFRHYAGHQARLAHESETSRHLNFRMMEDTSLISVTADFAMKYLPRKDSEAQTDFFGKRGIIWHGICILWFCHLDKKFKQYFVNQCVEDSTEDGIAIIALLHR